MLERVESLLPRLRGADYSVTSPQDELYNCIAWAAGVTNAWWWPGEAERTYWPTGLPREETLEVFRALFARLGYAVCPVSDFETGFEKIALFADDQGKPKHAARQVSEGRWTSKLGRMEDIEHELRDLEGTVYGSVVLIMKRVQASGST